MCLCFYGGRGRGGRTDAVGLADVSVSQSRMKFLNIKNIIIISSLSSSIIHCWFWGNDDDSEAAEAIVGGLEASCVCDECGEVARLLGAIFHQRGAESSSRREVRLGAQAPSCCHTAPPTPPRL